MCRCCLTFCRSNLYCSAKHFAAQIHTAVHHLGSPENQKMNLRTLSEELGPSSFPATKSDRQQSSALIDGWLETQEGTTVATAAGKRPPLDPRLGAAIQAADALAPTTPHRAGTALAATALDGAVDKLRSFTHLKMLQVRERAGNSCFVTPDHWCDCVGSRDRDCLSSRQRGQSERPAGQP